MNTRKITVAAASLILVGGVYASSAGATPGSTGPLAPTPDPNPPVSAPLDDSEDGEDLEIEQDDVVLEVEDETIVQMFELTYPAGSFSGWHSHAGIVLAVVKSGSVVRETGCRRAETFVAGQSFYEVGPHHVSNPGPDPAVLSITRIFPADLGGARIDEPAPRCHR